MVTEYKAKKQHVHTIETAGNGIIVLDNTLVDEDTLGSYASVDLDGVVSRVHGIDDEAVHDV